MATAVFTPCAGGVAKIDLCRDGAGFGGGTFNITVGDGPLGLPVNGFIFEMQGNYQFLHSLDQFVYYYNFGDRVGELTVSGFGFLEQPCNEVTTGLASQGVCGILDFYLNNRQAKLKKALTIGADKCGTFFAFLTGMRIEMSSGNLGVPVGQWSLRFHVIPPRPGS
jgi:hypothetical protein